MQAVFYEREKYPLSSSQERDESRTQNKMITRKQGKRSSNMFKKKKQEEDYPLQRDKRCHSSHLIKFVKNQSTTDERENLPHNREFQESRITEEELSPSKGSQKHSNSPRSKPSPKKSLVFNKFSNQQKEQIRDYLISIKRALDQTCTTFSSNEIFLEIEAYITKIEENNSKLLEVNYFFQKEFNEIMAEKQLSKRLEKCNKNYCMECRYHLEKENRWKQQKLDLVAQVARLREELSSVQTSKYEEQSKNASIILQSSIPSSQNDAQHSILKLREQLQEKDEQYLILLKQFNYLDSINKDLKNRISKLIEEYKYLSIQNRTLLNTKTKLIEKELECIKYKDERDYFKKKVIDNHKKNQAEMRNRNGHCKCSSKAEESIFSLSSVSNEQSYLQSIDSFSNITPPLESPPKCKYSQTS